MLERHRRSCGRCCKGDWTLVTQRRHFDTEDLLFGSKEVSIACMILICTWKMLEVIVLIWMCTRVAQGPSR